jgi:hypothetical protein
MITSSWEGENMAAEDIDKLRYVVLPGAVNREFSQLQTYCDVYQLWKTTWLHELAGVGGDPSMLSSSDFMRQSEMSVILNQREVVAFILSTYYDLTLPFAKDSKYFSRFSGDIMDKLVRHGNRVFTMEFLTVNPDWRDARAGAPMGAVMLALAVRRSRAWNADVATGAARISNRVDAAAMELGGTPIGTVTQVKFECEVMAFYPHLTKPHSNLEVNRLVSRFWENQADYNLASTYKVGKLATA